MAFHTFASIVLNVLLSCFQCLKSINISSKHTKSLCTRFYISLCITLSVSDIKGKLGIGHFKTFFFRMKSGLPLASLACPSCFYLFSTPCESFFCQTQYHLVLYFMAFHSSGVSFLTGQ